MTTRTAETSHLIYARVAGFTFLFYIAAGMTSLALGDQTNITDVLSLLTSLSALVLGVTLYVLTREQGPALALLALTCRVLEAVSPSDEAAIFFAVGSTIFWPSVAISSSTPNPGPSVAISKSTPLGSRK